MIGGIMSPQTRWRRRRKDDVEVPDADGCRHVQETRERGAQSFPPRSGLISLTWLGWLTAHTYHCGEGEKVVELQGQ